MSEQYCDTCGREDRPLTVVGDVYQCDRHVPTPSGGPAPRSTPLSAYRDVIATAITDAGYPDHLDTATISLVEDCLRTNRTGLDHLSREDFAVETYAILTDLIHHPDQTRTLCELLGFEIPGWVERPPAAQPLSVERTSETILATLHHAFPHTRFRLTRGHGAARSHLVLSWVGGPAKSSVDDVLAQFLPDPNSLTSPHRYSCVAIFTCRQQPLPKAV